MFRSGHPVHVKYLLHARRAGVSCELCSCDLSVVGVWLCRGVFAETERDAKYSAFSGCQSSAKQRCFRILNVIFKASVSLNMMFY